MRQGTADGQLKHRRQVLLVGALVADVASTAWICWINRLTPREVVLPFLVFALPVGLCLAVQTRRSARAWCFALASILVLLILLTLPARSVYYLPIPILVALASGPRSAVRKRWE